MKLSEDEIGSIALLVMTHGGGVWKTFDSYGLDDGSGAGVSFHGVAFVHNGKYVARIVIAKTRNDIETLLGMQMSQELFNELAKGNVEALRHAEVYQLETTEAPNV
jgi:hypothetical protein